MRKKDTEKETIDWSKGEYRKHIIEQRKFLWRDDSIELYAKWMGLKDGMTCIDVGCGLGYLGWTFWKYFGKGGKYVGIDVSEKLISEAKELSKEWLNGGSAEFIVGDVYDLPLADNSVDFAMCQTLLMHLKEPEKALTEMKRVVKPGGVVICMEPDNFSNSMKMSYNSINQRSVEEMLLIHKIQFCWVKGRKKLSERDWGIGSKLPKLMNDAGLKDIDIRNNDIVKYMIPLYETPEQEDMLQTIKGNYKKPFNKRDLRESLEEKVLAGGGSRYFLRQFYDFIKRTKEEDSSTFLKEVMKKRAYVFWGASFFYICIGRK